MVALVAHIIADWTRGVAQAIFEVIYDLTYPMSMSALGLMLFSLAFWVFSNTPRDFAWVITLSMLAMVGFTLFAFGVIMELKIIITIIKSNIATFREDPTR